MIWSTFESLNCIVGECSRVSVTIITSIFRGLMLIHMDTEVVSYPENRVNSFMRNFGISMYYTWYKPKTTKLSPTHCPSAPRVFIV
jgi:hypothetical protein